MQQFDDRGKGQAGGVVDRERSVLPQLAELTARGPITQSSAGRNTETSRGMMPRPVLSVIIPAFNEEERMGAVLAHTLEYLRGRGEPFEVIVVDDGSSDGTARLVEDAQSSYPELRLIRLTVNQGKGNAVKTGVSQAEGRYILFTDADGSTPIEEVERLLAEVEKGADVAIGSRALASRAVTVDAKWYRKLPGRIFAFCANQLLIPGIKDTQCGFKLFTAEAAEYLFQRQEQKRWSFDLELLYVGQRAGMHISEVPVNWKHAEGSKVNVLADGLKMLREMLIIRQRHMRRANTPPFKRKGGYSEECA